MGTGKEIAYLLIMMVAVAGITNAGKIGEFILKVIELFN